MAREWSPEMLDGQPCDMCEGSFTPADIRLEVPVTINKVCTDYAEINLCGLHYAYIQIRSFLDTGKHMPDLKKGNRLVIEDIPV
jgi:hypothetical protein